MTYLIHCSWCGDFLGLKTDDRPPDKNQDLLVSHGICPECGQRVTDEALAIRPGSVLSR
ncbi:MAG: hypothetical protein V1789_08860 [PVC group bacterium]